MRDTRLLSKTLLATAGFSDVAVKRLILVDISIYEVTTSPKQRPRSECGMLHIQVILAVSCNGMAFHVRNLLFAYVYTHEVLLGGFALRFLHSGL